MPSGQPSKPSYRKITTDFPRDPSYNIHMSVRESSDKPVGVDTKTKSAARAALYRKYRPTNLDEVIGQPQVTEILKSVAKSRDFSHAYLLTGQRGTGKTSVARILAHLINQTSYNSDDIDIIEIDAASRGSVDDARELREKSVLAPVAASHKVYIIDEVHMLSTAAFNALLKLIEEPPEHIIFILATTEIQKVPATILSRVQRFHFRPVSVETVASHLSQIAKSESIDIDTAALDMIAERGGGSFRDSISLLDQLSGSGKKISSQTVSDVLGLAPEESVNKIIDSIISHDFSSVVSEVNMLLADGINVNLLVNQLTKQLLKLAPEKPKLYDLIERLIEVPKSSASEIKLIAVLATASAKKSTVASAVASPPTETKLTKIIEQKIKHESAKVETHNSKSIENENPVIDDQISNTKTGDNHLDEPESNTIDPEDLANISEIDWQKVLDTIKSKDEPTVLATMKFADVEYDSGVLTIYFSRPFHRKKAETPKMRGVLADCLKTLYGAMPQIVISKTAHIAIDSKNSTVAEVAAIMGGGEIIKETSGGQI